MKLREPLFPGNYERLPLDSDERPIKIIKTVHVPVPQGSEKYADHYVDDVRFLDSSEGQYHRLLIPSGAMVAHVDDENQVALVKNFRHALGHDSVELPSGGIDENVSSLVNVLTPEDAEALVLLAKEQNVSIIDLLGPEQAEEVIVNAAIREMGEEIGLKVEPEDIERLIPKLYAAVNVSGHAQNIFYATGGHPVPTKHDKGEAGILQYRRFSIGDAGEMIGYEIRDPATTTAISSLAQMYGIKPTWLPAVKKGRKHIPLED